MQAIIEFILTSIWYMLPAYIANISPIFAKRIPHSDYPVDFNLKWRGKRIFGNHKTWRGIVVGIAVGTIIAILQNRPLAVGVILAGGNFIGDLVGALIKRQLDITPGQKSLIVDSLPGPLFVILTGYTFGMLTISWAQALFIIAITVPLHLGANSLWHRLRLKSVPW